MKKYISFILLSMVLVVSTKQKLAAQQKKKLYGTLIKPRTYMFDKPLFGNKVVLEQNDKVELIETVDDKIKVFIYNKYGYVYQVDLKQDAEYLEFKSLETQRTNEITKQKERKLEEETRIENELLSKFDSIKQAYRDSSSYIIRSKKKYITLFDTPNGKILDDSLSRTEALKVIKIDHFYYLKVQGIYHNKIVGYILKNDAEIDSELQAKIIKSEEEREESYKGFLKEKNRILQERLAKERKIESENKRKKLTAKYGSATANRLINGEIWIGMTMNQAVESLGNPNNINETVTARGKDHQFVYDNLYLYFKDGVLTTYQKRY